MGSPGVQARPAMHRRPFHCSSKHPLTRCAARERRPGGYGAAAGEFPGLASHGSSPDEGNDRPWGERTEVQEIMERVTEYMDDNMCV